MGMEACTVFTTALCNLNCSYCYICKDQNGGLAQIDKDLEQGFKERQYIKSILAFGENTQNTLHTISLWGGEPFLHVERFTEQIGDWFDAFPNLEHFTTSTNFTVPGEIEKIKTLLDAITKLGPKKRYSFELQVSIDGYPEMNDFGRGKGVTEKFLKHWRELLEMQYDKNKIAFSVVTKPTLSKSTFKFLDTKEKCEKWFRFFSDEMYKPYVEKGSPFPFSLALFNCATPTEWTKEDGKQFAEIAKNIASLNQEDYPGWEHYYSLLWMANCLIGSELNGEKISELRCGGTCGAFVASIVPIPNGKYSVCHRGLFDNYVDYCNNTNNKEYMNGLSKSFFAPKDRNKWLLSLDEFKQMHHTMCKMNTCENAILFTDYLVAIREYAKAGIIESKYTDIDKIKPTIRFFMSNSYCMQDGFVQNGSWTTPPTYEIPLMYNGAMDVAVAEAKKYMQKFKEEK